MPTEEYLAKKERVWRVKLPAGYKAFIQQYSGGMPIELLPIAALFAGDFLCLDFRDGKEIPSVCVWSHEESDIDEPVAYEVANNFEEFCEMLID